jgi:hypothetical protein
MPISFVLVMFVLPIAIIAMAVVLAELSRRAERSYTADLGRRAERNDNR